jgi:hypothetical protein
MNYCNGAHCKCMNLGGLCRNHHFATCTTHNPEAVPVTKPHMRNPEEILKNFAIMLGSGPIPSKIVDSLVAWQKQALADTVRWAAEEAEPKDSNTFLNNTFRLGVVRATKDYKKNLLTLADQIEKGKV